jgi:UDPglucose--hexose-1-phosphate uridylyltransferase
MSELRQNFATKEWVVIATERARRPEEMVRHREHKPEASFVATCPFCPGNEKSTPPEVLRVPASLDVPWHARVIPNKFAALSRDVQPTRTVHRSRRAVNGFGVHDVIIETPDHSLVLARMPDSYVAEILRIYKTRYDELSLDPRVAMITISRATAPTQAQALNIRTPR